MYRTNFDDVGDFHEKFGWPNRTHHLAAPHPLTHPILIFRIKFMLEELAEYADSQGVVTIAAMLRQVMKAPADMWVGVGRSNLAEGADALVDLAYVVQGTAHHHHFNWQPHWDEVQRANMLRVPGVSKRGITGFDVVKPPDWLGPDHQSILRELGVEDRYL